MTTSTHEYAGASSWRSMWVGTLITAALAFALPVLLLTIDPGGDGETIDPGATTSAAATVTFQAPDGWSQRDGQQGQVLTKGQTTMEIISKPFTGSAADLYQDFVDQLETGLTVNSVSDPTPASLSDLEAVSGTIHFLLNGSDTTSMLVAGVDGQNGVTVSFFGPLSALNSLQSEYEAILASIEVAAQ